MDWTAKVGFKVEEKDFYFTPQRPDSSGAHPASYPMGTECSFPGGGGGEIGRGLKLITHLHLVPRSKMVTYTPTPR
jgi:hypothetical protein